MTAIANTAAVATATKARTPLATRIGRGISVAVVLFLLFDATIHLLHPAEVEQGFQQAGFPVYQATVVGLLELGSLILFLIPRTQLLGALLLTAYLGGAFCANLRMEAPLFSTLLAPVYVGVVLWAGLYLRNAAVRKALGVDILAGRR
jgi:hypothetical protein